MLKRDNHESMIWEQVGANPSHKRTCVKSQFWGLKHHENKRFPNVKNSRGKIA
jgi:hypothetical protein